MKIETNVLDIGARYGLHPSWKKLVNSEFKFFLFEPEPNEAKRLKKKYKGIKNIKIVDKALGDSNKKITLNVTKHTALSSIFLRKNNNPLLQNATSREVQKKVIVNMMTLANFCNKFRLSPHFIKLDTEGTELMILENAKMNLTKTLAIRSEVSFEKIFNHTKEGDFCKLHNFLISNDFILLNLDYDGKGFKMSEQISDSSKFGFLQTTDAVWIKNPKKMNVYYNDSKSILRISLFCFFNNAPDVAIFFLLKNAQKYNHFQNLKNTETYKILVKSLAKHFYNIRWSPNQKFKEHKKIFKLTLGLDLPEYNQYNESLFYNP